ncbi:MULTISPECIES: TerC family protein [Bacillaceae]|uniref:TerC family protein n=1 Tax=Evansella alkalicola TaxID=745819 RepID=A0ABS6JSW7_9BACI|nr:MULTISPECIES: TerC family protein [Bacillaceae]MBU9720794.1 TerC family protein [Bacillus alkalicola]
MEAGIILEYSWILLILIGLEGILAADNALVLAIMVKHLPEEQRKKALFYGLAGAFVFRFGSLFLISYLVNIWQVQAVGAIYLLFIAMHHVVKKFLYKKDNSHTLSLNKKDKKPKFWTTVLRVEIADIAFAVDSILAAAALAVTLTPTGLFQIGELDVGQFSIVLTGGLVGVIIMRFAATHLGNILQSRPNLETAGFLIVGWVGVKLAVYTLAHPDIHFINEQFPESVLWKGIFWTVLIAIAIIGWTSTSNNTDSEQPLRGEEPLLDDEPSPSS